MSILLDAVTRNKQQQMGTHADPVMTPRAQLQQVQSQKVPWQKLTLLCVAIGIAVGSAWGLAQWREPSAVVRQSDNHSSDVHPAEMNPLSAASPEMDPRSNAMATQTRLAVADDETTGVQLAGKVALPMAKAYVDPDVAAREQAYYAQVHNQHQASTVNTRLFNDDAFSANGEPSTPDSFDDTRVSDVNEPIYPSNAEQYENEPIMLGANANRRGLAELEALKRQVDVAASDVGLESAPMRDENNLVAAFQAALADVEKDKALAAPMSSAKLAPIEAPAKADDYPKYGQLPAGLQLQVPEFNIVAHVYATDPSQRWLNVDGAELQQGDSIKGKLKIIEIRPRDVVLEIAGTEFKVPAI